MNYGFEPYLLYHPLILSLVWMVLYTSDYYLTLASVHLYKRQNYYKIEGSFELTPQYQKDIDNENKFSFRFLALLLGSGLAIYALGSDPSIPRYVMSVVAGCLIVMELAVHVRHIENIMLYRRLTSDNPGTSGQLTVTKENSYKRSATQLTCYGGMVFALYLLTASWMLFGGTMALLGIALQHSLLARRHAGTNTATANTKTAEQPKAKEQP